VTDERERAVRGRGRAYVNHMLRIEGELMADRELAAPIFGPCRSGL
jgi:hypothetical protein